MTHKGKLALLKYWKNLREHTFKRPSQTSCLSWASENTWSPWGEAGDDWVYRSGACPAARVGTGGLSLASLPAGRAGTGLIPSPHDLHLKLSCSGAGKGWPSRTMPLFWPCWRLVWSDRIREETLTTPETDHQNSLDGLQLSQLS